MKKIGLTLSLVLALGGNAMACGYWHVWGFWPSFSRGIGLGGVFGCSLSLSPACGCYFGCANPVYSCAYPQPAYAYVPGSSYAAPPLVIPSPAQPPEPPAWVPSTPGAGRWVPDPTPYCCTPCATASRPAEVKTAPPHVVTVTRSPEGIPVYSIGYLK